MLIHEWNHAGSVTFSLSGLLTFLLPNHALTDEPLVSRSGS
jgi:hypothetical protein